MIVRILKEKFPLKFKNFIYLIVNFISDFILYFKYSTIFKSDSLNKKEAKIILNYHSLEKALLYKEMKPRFGIEKIKNLHLLLNDSEIIDNAKDRSQLLIAYYIMIDYYDIHTRISIDISDYFDFNQYSKYKEIVSKDKKIKFHSGKLEFNSNNFYKEDVNFHDFAFSRKSIRDFNGDIIDIHTINKVIELSNSAPSVCNRQSSKVYLVNNKEKIRACLKIQGGFNGFIDNVNQLLILTSDREYFYTTGERSQFYIDGGIYLMNLLYALHYYKIAACPANWGVNIGAENRLSKIITFPKSEKIICMIPIGYAPEKFSTTLSHRRSVDEVLHIIN